MQDPSTTPQSASFWHAHVWRQSGPYLLSGHFRTSHLEPDWNSLQRHFPFVFSQLTLNAQSQYSKHPSPHNPTGHCFWQFSPMKPDAHLHLPLNLSHSPPLKHSGHCQAQFAPQDESSQGSAQTSPVHPVVQLHPASSGRHVPLFWHGHILLQPDPVEFTGHRVEQIGPWQHFFKFATFSNDSCPSYRKFQSRNLTSHHQFFLPCRDCKKV